MKDSREAYILLAEGFEEMEVTFPISVLKTAEIDVETVSITNNQAVTGSHGITIIADSIWSNCDIKSGDALILPGGQPGTENLKRFFPLRDILMFYLERKIIGAICAAPTVLANAGVLDGKRATCYPGYEVELKGANFIDTSVVVDNNIITANGPGAAKNFALKLVEMLADDETVKKVNLIYN